jgi:magnesium transporter
MIPEGAVPPALFLMHYDANGVEEHELEGPDEIPAFLEREGKTWLDVRGFGDEAVLQRLKEVFSIHPLALEDVVHTTQRPKTEQFDQHQLYITRMLRLLESGLMESEQVSILFGDRYVVTVQERPGDVLDPVRNRLRQGRGPMRRMGPDYLAYALLDAVIDGYYPVVEQLGAELEELEDLVLENPSPEILARLNTVKRDLLRIRRCIWPQRDAINSLLRGDSDFVSEDVRVYLRDSYDHCVQMSEVVETFRELTSGLQNTYLSAVANRTNDVMKVLTIMATIFIPLTFLAGIYGMNFEHMPETKWEWAYGAFWIVTVTLGLGLFEYFRRKGWVGKS